MYAHCDPFKRGEIKKVDQIVPYFVVNELLEVPGMIGLFTACIFSAVLRYVGTVEALYKLMRAIKKFQIAALYLPR